MKNRKKIIHKTAVFIALALFLCTNLVAFADNYTQAPIIGADGPLVLKLDAPAYTIIKDELGFDMIEVEDFNLSGVPGESLLPRKVYNIALPPNAELESLRVEIVDAQVVKLPETYNLKLAVQDTPGNESDISAYYNFRLPAQANTQAEWVKLYPPGKMRKWISAPLEFSPFQYDSASGELSMAKSVTIELNYDLSPAPLNAALLHDTVMDDLAQEMFINYDSAQAWYETDLAYDKPDVTYNYVIITTNAIEAGSSKLSNFITHKQSKGYKVLTITEDQYGSLSGQAPNGTAEKIRKWLQNNYIAYSIEYVLLIGNPDPDDPSLGSDTVGDVPMKMMWPRNHLTTYKESPTDYFYADLTGNWDKNGNQYYGEWTGDYSGVTGGVDFAPEVYVGRIPSYGTSYTNLDNILQKTIDYENEVSPMSWRKSALLPMSFSEATYDGAPLAEQMIDYYLSGKGYSDWTMYQQGNGACSLNSTYASDQELRGGTGVRDRWAANDYGLVLWWGHGSATTAMVGFGGCDDGNLMISSYATSLDDNHPSHVYLNSCNNGYPENSGNLGYALLKNGAISTISASRVSWYNKDVGYGQFDGSTTNSGIGYEYAKRLVNFTHPAGNALYNAKSSMTPGTETRLMNYYDFNLYGDPSTSITSSSSAPLNQVFLPVVTRDYTPPAGFDSQFNGDYAGWTPIYGTWSIYYNYAFEGYRSGTGWASAVQDGDYANFDYSARLWRSGSEYSTTGIIFRAATLPLTWNQRWSQGYMFGYLRDGRYAVWRFNSDGSENALKGWTTSSYINTGNAWNTLRVVAEGSVLNFYINGHLVFTASDSNFSSGKVGLVMYTPDGTTSKIWADWATLSPSGSSAPMGTISPEQQAFNEADELEGDASGVLLPEGEEPEFESLPPTP